MHRPPPSATNGSGVMQPPGVGAGGGGVGVGTMPGGNHPPFTHVPPPKATKGSGECSWCAPAEAVPDRPTSLRQRYFGAGGASLHALGGAWIAGRRWREIRGRRRAEQLPENRLQRIRPDLIALQRWVQLVALVHDAVDKLP